MTAKNAVLAAMSRADLVEVIERLHFGESKSLRDIARGLGVPYPSFHTELRRHDIETKSRKASLLDKFAGRGPNWTGGRVLFRPHRPNSVPYVYVFHPEHPNANSRGYVLEHRYVMAMKIGRALTDREIVHHVNGDTMNNSPDNLEVRLRGGAGHGHGPLTVCPHCGKDLLRY